MTEMSVRIFDAILTILLVSSVSLFMLSRLSPSSHDGIPRNSLAWVSDGVTMAKVAEIAKIIPQNIKIFLKKLFIYFYFNT